MELAADWHVAMLRVHFRGYDFTFFDVKGDTLDTFEDRDVGKVIALYQCAPRLVERCLAGLVMLGNWDFLRPAGRRNVGLAKCRSWLRRRRHTEAW